MRRTKRVPTRLRSSNALASVALAACGLLVTLAACGGARQAATHEGASPIRAVTPDARASEAAVEPYAGKMVYVIVAETDQRAAEIVKWVEDEVDKEAANSFIFRRTRDPKPPS